MEPIDELQEILTIRKDELSDIEVTGIQGEKGEQGNPGVDGKDGLNGKDGRDGVDGLNGADGRDGVDGTNGVDGKDGEPGKDGSPDTPNQVVDKVNLASNSIRKDKIQGLLDIERMVQANGTAVTTSFFNGLRAKNLTIANSTASQQGDTVTVNVANAGMTIGETVIGGDPNDVLFVGNGGLLAQDDKFQWNPTTHQLFIGGTSDPTGLTIQFLVEKQSGSALFGAYAAGAGVYTDVPTFFGIRGQGTLASPTNPGDGYPLFNVVGTTVDSNNNFIVGNAPAVISFVQDGSAGVGFAPGLINFSTTPTTGGLGPIRMQIRSSGLVGIGNVATSMLEAGQLHVQPNSASTIGLIVEAAASQTADLMEFQDSSTNVLARFTPKQAQLELNKSTSTWANWTGISGSSTNKAFIWAEGAITNGTGNASFSGVTIKSTITTTVSTLTTSFFNDAITLVNNAGNGTLTYGNWISFVSAPTLKSDTKNNVGTYTGFSALGTFSAVNGGVLTASGVSFNSHPVNSSASITSYKHFQVTNAVSATTEVGFEVLAAVALPVGLNLYAGTNLISTYDNSQAPLVLRGASGQNSAILQIQSDTTSNLLQVDFDGSLLFGPITVVPTPSPDYGRLYVDNADGNLYYSDTSSNVYQLTPPESRPSVMGRIIMLMGA